MGTSRIYLGYHYLTDVIGGLAAATLWILVVVGAFSWGQHLLDGRRGSPDPQPVDRPDVGLTSPARSPTHTV